MKLNLIVTFILVHFFLFNRSFTHENASPLEALFSDVFYEFDHNQEEKDWTFIVFIAGDNNLSTFIAQNIKQMLRVGSNKRINIVIRVDTKLSDEKKITKFLYVDKDLLIQISPDLVMDSGNPDDLITFFNIVYDRYPAKNWGLVLWDHGIGCIDDAQFVGIENYDEWNLLNRGICFDDSTLHYLTNNKLAHALDAICKIIGKKLDLFGCDACFMNMWEFLKMMRYYIGVAVGSQEIEPVTGWDYFSALKDFDNRSLSPHELADTIVQTYSNLYEGNRDDYTQSAINLENFDGLNKSIENFAQELFLALRDRKNVKIKEIVRKCRTRQLSTVFDEPSYIDLGYFCFQIVQLIKNKKRVDSSQKIAVAAQCVIDAIDKVIIANKTAKDVKAYGISIYFPEDSINFSYYENSCPAQDAWIRFLELYLAISKY